MIDSIKSNANIIANTIIAGRDIKMIKANAVTINNPMTKVSAVRRITDTIPQQLAFLLSLHLHFFS